MNINPALTRNTVMFVTALTLSSTWLPMMRTISGQNTYVWAHTYFNAVYRGVGLSGDYLFLIYQAIIGLTVLWMGFRNPRAPFHLLLVIWHAIPFGSALYLPLIAKQKNIFYGDTAGLRADLTLISPVIHGLIFAGVCAWVVLDVRKTAPPSEIKWVRKNSYFCAVFLTYLVGATILEWTGPTHGATDQVVVPLNILAPILIALMFYPWQSRSVQNPKG